MHSFDRTLLAKLGFADPDKGNSRHDLACQYLAQKDVVTSLVASITGKEPSKLQRVRSFPESPLSKGEGQYKTTIGFLDLLVRFDSLEPSQVYEDHRWVPAEDKWIGGAMAIEVKISPVSLGDIIRQVNLYAEYQTGTHWLVVTEFSLSPEDVATLKSASIRHRRLGGKFSEYVKERESRKSPKDQDLSGNVEI